MATQKLDLIIPVYLNQRLVFDLVAMLQGGIATVTRISEAHRDTSEVSGEVTGGFGLSQALASLLKVNLSGKMAGGTEGSVESTSTADRVHTPASLFFTLRNLLIDRGMLQNDGSHASSKPGEFVEFTASLRRNPLIEGLDSIVEIIDMVWVFMDEPAKSKHQGGKQLQQNQPNLKHLQGQLDSLSKSLKSGGTQDLVATLTGSRGRAVLTVEKQYLNDPSMSDLVDGTFRVVGKVIRSVDTDQDSISLLRKTAMSRVPPNVLNGITEAFGTLTQQHGFAMPTMEVEIKGPVMQILPLAIFS
ncbi:MAG: hypothetical protein LAN70_05655 [Acidobacteriia bacterium]|nr:hypothetical protein [Terriglobia bacterium]